MCRVFSLDKGVCGLLPVGETCTLANDCDVAVVVIRALVVIRVLLLKPFQPILQRPGSVQKVPCLVSYVFFALALCVIFLLLFGHWSAGVEHELPRIPRPVEGCVDPSSPCLCRFFI